MENPAAQAEVNSTTNIPASAPENVSLPRNIKLGLFHLGSSMADILASGVWNRIAINELGLASTPVALLLALKYFLAPLSIWIGQRSDVTSVRGYRRLPYVWGGRAMMMLSYFVIGLATVTLADDKSSVLGWLGLVIAFLMFSVGAALSNTTFISLIYDVSPGEQRTRVISVVWFVFIAGFPIAGILFGRLLPHYTRDGFLTMFMVVPLIIGALWFFSLLGEETPRTAQEVKQSVAQQRGFWQQLSGVWANAQTRIFFLFLGLTTLFFYTQDAILEPFGGEVFGMPSGTTSRFATYWGSTTLIGILLCLWLSRRYPGVFNNTTLTRIGVVVLFVTFVLFFICAVFQIRPLVTIGLIVLGIGLGAWTVGTLGLMMDMTRAYEAGLYLSLWTVSETVARGLGTLLGGVIRDVALAVSGRLPVAYGTVFLVQAIGFAVTLVLLSRVNVTAFQQAPSMRRVMEAAMD